jgi:hypothetical protein
MQEIKKVALIVDYNRGANIFQLMINNQQEKKETGYKERIKVL